MPQSGGQVLRRCGGRQCPPGTCDHDGTLRRHAATATSGPSVAPPSVHRVLNSPGHPLDPGARAHLEPRFGHDFSQVRVHTDAAAAASAEAVGARAYTVGSHVAFAAGSYRPGTDEGRRLIAHELAHTLQQPTAPARSIDGLPVGAVDDPAEQQAEAAAEAIGRGGDAPMGRGGGTARGRDSAPALRRACPPHPTNIAATPLPTSACATGDTKVVSGSVVGFCTDSTEILDGQTGWLDTIVDEAKASPTVEIHGNASVEGPSAQYNVTLSCMRAAAFRDYLVAHGVTTPITLVAHGPTAAYGPAPTNRNVVVRLNPNSCGPNATDWFIRQVAAAKTDKDVLQVRAHLTTAAALASSVGYSAERIAEGAVLQKVLEQEKLAGNPPRKDAAPSQIAAAAPGATEFSNAKVDAAVSGIGGVAGGVLGGGAQTARAATIAAAFLAIRSAGLQWAGLVGTKRRYDFKYDTGTMKGPVSPNCPKGCANTITLAPTTASDCYRTDVPGNIFYAHVGRFIGWTELSLQLGSEFAQLASTKTWDPPEDTALITAAYALPDPLTSGGLAAMLAANRSIFDVQPCLNCTEPTSAVIR